MAGKLKEAILNDIRALIKNLSGFEEEEPNFNACEVFILSHVLYHKFLSVDRHALQRTMDGIVLKLNVHGLLDKSREFDEAFHNFLQAYDPKESDTVDAQWSLLSLLVQLANNPCNVSSSNDEEEVCHSVDEYNEGIDWGKYLLEGFEEYHQDWNEESDFDEDVEESSSTLLPETELPQSNSKSNSISISSQVRRSPELTQSVNVRHQIAASETWLKSHVQHSWWTKADTCHAPLSAFPAAHSAAFFDKVANSSVRNSTISEHKAILEILWMLSAPHESFLFMKVLSEDGLTVKFSVRPHVSIPSIWHKVFVPLLCTVCECAGMVKTLRDFSLNIYHGHVEGKAPLTYHAYERALQIELQPMYEFIANLEQRVHKQDETFTILIILDQLRPWLKKLSYLHNLHQNAILDWKKHPNWLCATYLLSLLISNLEKALLEERATVFRIFITTFKVYLDIVDEWHSVGQLLDWREEFLVSKCENSTGFLGAGFEKRDWESKLTALGVDCPKYLRFLADYVLKSAQPLHVLYQLNRLAELQRLNSERRSLYSWFLGDLISSFEIIQPYNEPPKELIVKEPPWWDQIDRFLPKVPKCLEWKNNEKIDDFIPRNLSLGLDSIMNRLSRLEDPLLLENFSSILGISNDNCLLFSSSSDALQEEYSAQEKVVNITQFLPESFPLEWCVEKAVLGLPAIWEGIAGTMVADILISEQQLLVQVQNAHSVFMLQAGHKLQPFVSHLFSLMVKRVDLSWTNEQSLSVLLQDCLDSDNFTVSIVIDDRSLHDMSVLECIDCLSIKYLVQWPLSVILGGSAETAYNAIFRLLLKLRWGLWNLEHIIWRGTGRCFNPLTQRLNLLRFQLLQVIGSSYSFLGCHILNVLSEKLCESLKNAGDLFKIVTIHERFLTEVLFKSLQADVPDPVKNAFFQLVVLAENLYLLWGKDQCNVSSSKLSNMEACYADCLSFLAVALRTLAHEGNQHHLVLLSDLVNWNIPNGRTAEELESTL